MFVYPAACRRWRADTGAERSLSTPQPTLDMIKQCYPYFVHGRSKKGEVVVYEQTGKMQFGRLADAGVSPFDMQVGVSFSGRGGCVGQDPVSCVLCTIECDGIVEASSMYVESKTRSSWLGRMRRYRANELLRRRWTRPSKTRLIVRLSPNPTESLVLAIWRRSTSYVQRLKL